MEKGEEGMWIGGQLECGPVQRWIVDMGADGMWTCGEMDGG
jgi:hypothetical protein